MKILLFGKNGQLGQEILLHMVDQKNLVAVSRNDIDLNNVNLVNQFLTDHNPDIIINAVACTAVDQAESEPHLAYQINAGFVYSLAKYASEKKCLLIHYSTDYVFDGTKDGFYNETDQPNPLNIYGLSKYQGELNIAALGCQAIIFRISWLFSPFRNNFLKTILQLAKLRSHIDVVNDRFGTPTSAALVAAVTRQSINAYIQRKMPTGIYHLASSGITTWYEFAMYIVEQAIANGIQLNLTSNDIHPVMSQAHQNQANRPANSKFDTSKLSQILSISLPSWQEQVATVVRQLV